MKKLFKVALVVVCMVSMSSFANAQKIGYINTNDLIPNMPEYKTVTTQVDAYKKTFVDVLQNLSNELQTKSADYQAHQATMTDAQKSAKQSELNDLNQRAGNYQNDAQQKVAQKGEELMKPLLDKAKNAITQVAKEKGYTYVIDSSTTTFIVAPPTDDLLAAVKAKLGITTTAAPAAGK
jgi:outer membrane protein